MKRKIVLSVAFLLALVLTLSVMPFASAATKAQNGLQFELTTDKEAYTTGESIQCELTVANSNDQELNITYEVILPEGLTLTATQRGVLQVAAGGKVTSDFAVQTEAKGADELPSTGDNFPLEVVAVLMVLSAVGCAVFFKKTRFVAFMLLCVMLIGVVEPALVNSAVAESYPEEAYQVEAEEEISEDEMAEMLAAQEEKILSNQPEEEFLASNIVDEFEIAQNVVVDNQLMTVKVVGTVTSNEVFEVAENAKALASTKLKVIDILGLTKFKLSWSKVSGATHYEIWHSTGSGYKLRTRLKSTTTSWTTTKGVAGVINTYKVRAVTLSGSTYTALGPYSTRTCYGMSTPTMSSVTHTSSSSENVRVAWNWMQGSHCSGYYVYRSLSGTSGTYSYIGKTTGRYSTSFVDTTRNGYYKVRPYYTGANGVTYTGPASGLKNMGTQYRALLIGQSYPNWSSGQLPGCANDAEAMRAMLATMTSPAYRSVDVKKKLNLTASQILSNISTAFQRAKANDVSLFYYSGHGASDYGWLCGVDSGNYVTIDQLRTALDKIPGKKIVILDSCYSGMAIGKGVSDDIVFASEKEAFQAINESIIATFSAASKANLATSKYYVITACSKVQTSSEVSYSGNGKRIGAFTSQMLYGCGLHAYDNSVISALYADANGDKDLTLHEVYTYTDDRVANYYGWPQDAQVYPTYSSQVLWGR